MFGMFEKFLGVRVKYIIFIEGRYCIIRKRTQKYS